MAWVVRTSTSTTGCGMCAGPMKAMKVSVTKSGNPASIIVGTLGKFGERERPVTARGTSLPAAIIGNVACIETQPSGTVFCNTAATQGPPPG